MHAAVLSFAAFAALMVMTPGVGTAFLVMTVLDEGRNRAAWAACGMVLGAMTHAVFAALGISFAVKRIPGFLSMLSLAGGIVLIALGIMGLLRMLRARGEVRDAATLRGQPRGRLVAKGMTVQILNPTLMMFYLVIVPGYIPRDTPFLEGASILAAVHLSILVVWTSVLVYSLGGLAAHLRTPRVATTLRVISALVLVGFGVASIVRSSSV